MASTLMHIDFGSGGFFLLPTQSRRHFSCDKSMLLLLAVGLAAAAALIERSEKSGNDSCMSNDLVKKFFFLRMKLCKQS